VRASPGFYFFLLERLLIPAFLVGIAASGAQPSWLGPGAHYTPLLLGMAECGFLLTTPSESARAICTAGALAALYFWVGLRGKPAFAAMRALLVPLWQWLRVARRSWLGFLICVVVEKVLVTSVMLPFVYMELLCIAIAAAFKTQEPRGGPLDNLFDHLCYFGSKTGVCNLLCGRPPDMYTASHHWWY
jgi:hypothetical protein